MEILTHDQLIEPTLRYWQPYPSPRQHASYEATDDALRVRGAQHQKLIASSQATLKIRAGKQQ